MAWSPSLLAQDSTNTPAIHQHSPRVPTLAHLTKLLDLTDDQKPKVQAAIDDLKQKLSDLKADTSLSQEDRRAKLKTIHDEFMATLKGILTPEQFAKMQHGHRPPPPSGDNNNGTPPSGTPPQN
jgi:Spy/CpxP family protein refolding chaperone